MPGSDIIRLTLAATLFVAPALPVALPVLGAASPAAAQSSCDRWTSDVWEVEGGEAMTASVCAKGPAERPAQLYLQCWEPGSFALTFDDGGSGTPPGDDYEYKGTFVFSSGGTRVEKELAFMAMDGVMVADIKADEPLATLLAGDGPLTVSPPGPDFVEATFPLSGAREAIAAVAADCAAQ
ncbi:hypothetical protein J5J10_07285 [Ciceribacter sp. L1K23]|uniref:hypothetical protein n=1 Tax=Ciceribacter sp. L1K23 TaxID=2820276 RepID=UPI001B814B47|nr:hypothetical protein [Ciceribacter sp. L1K23]MBR0555481.1 hypothetical protein [Ciceribacter sp. L1K23]